MEDISIEEILLSSESVRRTRRTIDFSRVYTTLLRNPSFFRWSRLSSDFVSYSECNSRPIFITLYGPEEPQLDIGLCLSKEDYQTFRGQAVSDLYARVSRMVTNYPKPTS